MQEEADMAMEPRRRLGRGLDALLGAYPGGLGEPDFRDVILTVTANPQ